MDKSDSTTAQEKSKTTEEQKERPSYWAVLPAAVRYDPELSSSAKLLFAEISALTGETGYCFAKNSYFEHLYNLSERTVSRLIKDLAERGYIRIEDGSGGKETRKLYAGINPLSAPPDKNVGTPRQKCLPSPDKNVGENNKNNNKSINPPKAPQGAGADYVPKAAPDWKPERFAAFWTYFPLHKSKQAAIRAWDKLKPSDELLAVIGKALRRQIAEEKARAEKARRPFEWKLYASTYLNNARWTDAEEPQGSNPETVPQTENGGYDLWT